MSKLINFRDLSGILTKGGKTIAPNRLLRSGELSDLLESDIELLVDTHKLQNVVDMRTVSERDEKPDVVIDGVTNYHFDYFGSEGVMKNVPSMEQFFMNISEGASADEFMLEAYKDIVFSDSGKTGLRNFFKVLLETKSGATLWHCTAGKDRTGVSAALLLTILDVPYDAIVQDFLLTNEMRKPVNEAIIKGAIAKGFPEDKVNLIRPMLNVDKMYLDKTRVLIEEKYGTVANYLEKELGITEEVRQQFISLYTI